MWHNQKINEVFLSFKVSKFGSKIVNQAIYTHSTCMPDETTVRIWLELIKYFQHYVIYVYICIIHKRSDYRGIIIQPNRIYAQIADTVWFLRLENRHRV